MENQPKTKFGKHRWLLFGLLWGLLMFVFMGILVPLIDGRELTAKWILISLVTWMVTGLIFGYANKWWAGRQKRKNNQES